MPLRALVRRLPFGHRNLIPVAERGQSLVEFGLIVPLMLLLAVAVGDFGRLYTTAIAVESAAREAADYGAFLGKDRWDTDDPAAIALNQAEMARRACTAMAQLADYTEPTGTTNHQQCGTVDSLGNLVTPYYTFSIDQRGNANCRDADSLGESACVIHARVTFQFRPFLAFPGIPGAITLTRDSWFAVSDLTGT